MKQKSFLLAGILGGSISIVLMALTYIGERLVGLPFMPFDIFDWMSRHLPGALINFVIDTMVKTITALKLGPTASTAKSVENGIGLVQFVIAGIILGLILEAIGRNRPERLIQAGTIAGLVVAALMIFVEVTYRFPDAGPFLTVAWLIVIFTGGGAILGRLILELAHHPEPEPQIAASPQSVTGQSQITFPSQPRNDLSRRQFLVWAGAGSFAILVGATGLRLMKQTSALPATGATGAPVATQDLTKLINSQTGPAASPPQSVLNARFKPVDGTRPELTSNDMFYRIDINSDAPVVDGNSWTLDFGGLVNKPFSLSLADIRSRPSITQAVTMSCISNDLGGDLIGTTLWTGVPFKDILAQAGLKPGVKAINIKAVDGFYESVPLEEAMDGRTMLVYEMNGVALPVDHGFPLRIYIPNHYGMKQPKWITSMEAAGSLGPGYWVDRMWSATAIAQTTSVIDNIAVNEKDPQTGLIPIGGIAWAGARGISKVEVQVDNGSWDAAELRNPPLSPLTWVQWRYLWKAVSGYHTFSVRAYDGQGVLQVTDSNPTFPNGATGIVQAAQQIP